MWYSYLYINIVKSSHLTKRTWKITLEQAHHGSRAVACYLQWPMPWLPPYLCEGGILEDDLYYLIHYTQYVYCVITMRSFPPMLIGSNTCQKKAFFPPWNWQNCKLGLLLMKIMWHPKSSNIKNGKRFKLVYEAPWILFWI